VSLISASQATTSVVRPLRSGRNLARGERFLRTPGTRAYVTNAPRQGRGERRQPLPGCVSLFVFYPGVRFAHPRLSSSRSAGAEFGATEAVPSRPEAMPRRHRGTGASPVNDWAV